MRSPALPLADPASTGRLLFGTQWKTPLAEYLGVKRETVSRWSSGAQPMPIYAQRVLLLLVRSRGAVLRLCDYTGVMVPMGAGWI